MFKDNMRSFCLMMIRKKNRNNIKKKRRENPSFLFSVFEDAQSGS